MHALRLSLILLFLSTLHSLANSKPIELITVENLVEVSKDSGKTWSQANTGDQLDYGNHVRTGEYSRATLRYPSGNTIRMSEFSIITLGEPRQTGKDHSDSSLSVKLKDGAIYFFSRKKESESSVTTPTVNAAIRGTEFEIRVLPDQSTELSLFEGEVTLSNPAGQLSLNSGERASSAYNTAPAKLKPLQANSYMQWYLYYPAVLDTTDLTLSTAYQVSLDAYREGDLLGALKALPNSSQASSNEKELLFEAAVILASGQINAATKQLNHIQLPEADALQELIAAVKGTATPPTSEPTSATGWMARSYTHQSLGDLASARNAVQNALHLSPNFGYAWARLARLEFGFGENRQMQAALTRAYELNARNPEVYVLKGFEHAAASEMLAAEAAFDQAIQIAPNYPEAWLGKGLVGFHRAHNESALQDLLTAAALQPNNSMLRSYLAKGFAENHEAPIPFLRDNTDEYLSKALHELDLAKQLDPADPTPWLYSALIKGDALRYNEALADLEKSITLNDNRSLFRSKSLLDEDIAVRRSNLAEIYQQAGLPTQALAEAGKAVQSDYTNFAAHDFLARVYRERFDATNINQRNDNALANEFFLRNILAPVGAGIASQRVSNQEYRSLFNEQGLSGTVEASYDSRERYSSTGFFAYQGSRFEIAVELEREDWNEFYVNDDLETTTTQLHFRYQPTTQDRFYSLLVWSESEQGDLRSLPAPDKVNRNLQDYHTENGRTVYNPTSGQKYEVNESYGRDLQQRYKEEQKPLFFNTYAREWNESNTSLFLYGWANTEQKFEDTLFPASSANSTTIPTTLRIYESSVEIEQEFELHTFEFQHIWKNDRSQFIAGARAQFGDIEDDTTTLAAVNSLYPDFLVPVLVPFAIDSAGSQSTDEDFERLSIYSQFSYHLSTNLTLVAGLKYETMEYPDGYASIPRASDSDDASLLSPQAGFIWQIDHDWLLRGAYARSMSGYQLEDRLRLEPTNIGGITTSYASIAPSQIIANMPGGTIDTVQFVLTGKLIDDTYFSASAGYGKFDSDRTLGQFSESIPLGSFPNDPDNDPTQLAVSEVDQSIDYEEFKMNARIDHLLDARTSIGISLDWQYAQIDETLKSDFDLPATSPYVDDTHANLYIGSLYGRYQDPNGWFAQTDIQYWHQTNHSIEPNIDDESAPNLNLTLGFRLQKQKGEISFSILNMTDEQYKLNPVNFYSLPPQERTFVIQTRFSF